jgi:hypothetical protein
LCVSVLSCSPLSPSGKHSHRNTVQFAASQSPLMKTAKRFVVTSIFRQTRHI